MFAAAFLLLTGNPAPSPAQQRIPVLCELTHREALDLAGMHRTYRVWKATPEWVHENWTLYEDFSPNNVLRSFWLLDDRTEDTFFVRGYLRIIRHADFWEYRLMELP